MSCSHKQLLLIARPDHSYQIYKSLLESNIDFKYFTFKLLPKWTSKFIRHPSIRYVERDYSLCKRLTITHIGRLKSPFRKLFSKFDECKLFERHLSHTLHGIDSEIVHYWPDFCVNEMAKYKKEHPNSLTFADVYFPNERFVIKIMREIFAKYGLHSDLSYLEYNANIIDEVMKFEHNFIVPSHFVAETYRQYYPERNYIIIPYGITVSKNYQKKEHIMSSKEVRQFVYVGQVSLQKGCDILFNWFKDHTSYHLHIYGTIMLSQEHIFEQYKICENIHIHGSIAHSRVQKEIAQYDCGIHLSRFDAYSLAVGEMTGVGLPVIVSNFTGIKDDIISNHLGLVTDLDYKAVSQTIFNMVSPSVYNGILDDIDSFIHKNHKSYGEQIVDLYNSKLKAYGKDS